MKISKKEWEEQVEKKEWYYLVENYGSKITKGILANSYYFFRPLKENGELENFSRNCNSKNLFKELDKAEKRAKYLNKIYYELFKYKPFLNEELLSNNINKLLEIEKSITEGLLDYPNFEGIDFCDVSAGGINIRGHHKEISGYTYGNQPKIEYDFSNYKEVVGEFIEMWKNQDTPEKVKGEQWFISQGEKYGWD
ncbi:MULTISPECIES: hypothetical protein [Lysinibacillus]|uniref:hypothetical protein n=1 Tax=Lysinibacillus TaxID=400634 RepID=UPI00214B1B1B|nr:MULTISPECIES: hypothetical protein [Lysinibacillus]UUV25912.1 hypothetical protein NP781_04650 [Lysinibacillus sp. FN11]UYB48785.1 hypothetical protein OCI51_07440 [Lysinibacillus capsici]